MRKYLNWQNLLILVLLLAAVVSVYQGIKNGQLHSEDFQWSPTVVFLERTNPYEYFLEGNAGGRIKYCQVPNYAHLLYIVLLPFAVVDWDTAKVSWAIVNVLIGIFATIIINRSANLSREELWITLLVFLCSTPFRNTIGNGQTSLLVLVTYSALLLKGTYTASFWSGFSYFKYSFMPTLALFLLFKHGVKAMLLSSLACGIGWIIFSGYLRENPLLTLLQPVKVSSSLVGQCLPKGGGGTADLMSLVALLKLDPYSYPNIALYYILPLFVSGVVAYRTARLKTDNKLLVLSILSIGSLICFRHLGYDFVLLLPVYVYASKNKHLVWAKFIIAYVYFNWFVLKALFLAFEIPLTYNPSITIINFAACLLILSALFYTATGNNARAQHA